MNPDARLRIPTTWPPQAKEKPAGREPAVVTAIFQSRSPRVIVSPEVVDPSS